MCPGHIERNDGALVAGRPVDGQAVNLGKAFHRVIAKRRLMSLDAVVAEAFHVT